MTILRVKLPWLTKVHQKKAISDSIFKPMLIKSHTLCGLLQKNPNPTQQLQFWNKQPPLIKFSQLLGFVSFHYKANLKKFGKWANLAFGSLLNSFEETKISVIWALFDICYGKNFLNISSPWQIAHLTLPYRHCNIDKVLPLIKLF